MNLGELKQQIETFPKGLILPIGLSEPFSWRGSYDEVCFSLEEHVSVEVCLERIERALTNTFYGYKGGEFNYEEDTPVNFEENNGNWSDGEYLEEMINKMLPIPNSKQSVLVNLMLSKALENQETKGD